MTENPFEQAKEFDRLEALLEEGIDISDPEAADLAGELAVVQMLMADAQKQDPAMPREVEFTHSVMDQLVIRRRRRPWHIGLAVAAIFLVGFVFIQKEDPVEAPGSNLQMNAASMERLDRSLNKDAMVAYLNNTERLLLSIRDMEESCSEEGSNVSLEKEVAQDLLLHQKQFVAQLGSARYQGARALFTQLESILVDVKNLDTCTDSFEVELINEHINENRILGKLRLIAHEIQVS